MMFLKATSISLLLAVVALLHSTTAVPLRERCLDRCLINPCESASCPAVEGATCMTDYCGECNAQWFLNGRDVTDQCAVCPDGSRPVNCLVDPCTYASCFQVKGTTCQPDFCGGCKARWFLNGQEICEVAVPTPEAPVVVSESESRCQVPGQVYMECGTACPPTCADPNPICIHQCVEGCQCPEGTVLYRKRCISPKQCPLF